MAGSDSSRGCSACTVPPRDGHNTLVRVAQGWRRSKGKWESATELGDCDLLVLVVGPGEFDVTRVEVRCLSVEREQGTACDRARGGIVRLVLALAWTGT